MHISVITPVYNAAPFIKNAVQSALTHSEVKEILLVEDYSTDNSYDICVELAEASDKIKLFRHPSGRNSGAGAARNIGLENVTQPFTAFLDADDVFLPNRFLKTKEIFRNSPDVEGVYGTLDFTYLDDKAEETWSDFRKKQSLSHKRSKRKILSPDQLFDNLIGVKKNAKAGFSLDTLTIKTEVIQNLDLKFNEVLRLHQDTDFIWKLAYKSKLIAADIVDPISSRGMHANNRIVTTTPESKKLLYQSMYEWSKATKLPQSYRKFFRLKMHGTVLSGNSRFKYLEFLGSILLDPDRFDLMLTLLSQYANRKA